MSVENASPSRRRRTPENAKAEALAAARRLLLDQGPDAVTLKAVAAVMGVTHANLLHHFGSAGALQSELMAMMVRDLTGAIREAVAQFRAGEASLEALVDLVFDAFGEGGAGHLAAWLALTRETAQLEPIGEAVRDLAAALKPEGAEPGVERAIMLVTMMAFADAVIGSHLRPMLDQGPSAARDLTARLTPDASR